MTSASQVLNQNARTLLERGAHTRTLCQLAKLTGAIAAASGAAAILTGNVNPGAATATFGAALYVGAVGKELNTTGKVLPFPFFDADIGMIARQGVEKGERAERLTETDYLTLPERARLAMATTLKPLTLAIDNLPEDEQSTAYYMLANGLIEMYPDELARVDVLPGILPALGGMAQVQRDLTNTLPPAHREIFASAQVPEPLPPAPLPAPSPALPPQPSAQSRQQATAQYFPANARATGAIDVQAKTVQPTQQPPRRAVERKPNYEYQQPRQSEQPQVTALDTLQRSPFKSLAWFGGQRTGKSYLAAVASKRLHSKKGVRVFHINLASFGNEDDYYWSHVGEWDSVCCDISSMDIPTAKQHIAQAVQLVIDFYATANALLIVDEFAYIGSKNGDHAAALSPLLHVIADKIATLASTGMKRGKALWTLSPEFVAGSLVRDALAIKKLGLVFCAIAPGHKACWKDSAGQPHEITFDWSLYDMVSNNYAIGAPPPHNTHARLTYIDGQWISNGVTGNELGGAS